MKKAVASLSATAALALPVVADPPSSPAPPDENSSPRGTPAPPAPSDSPPQAAQDNRELRGKVRFWRRRAKRASRAARGLRLTLLHKPSVAEAINLAGATYGQKATLWRKARCESKLDPGATNPSGASGLFQFLGSTWRSTPYARFSVYSPAANALAAGWMHAHGRGGEWVCR